MILTLLAVPVLAAVIGYALGFAAIHFKVEGNPLVEEIASLLPNGQCGQCGFPGCAQAAIAMAEGKAAPNCCPPGGAALAEKVAAILGVTLGADDLQVPKVAAIDMEGCDGCGRCFKVCSRDVFNLVDKADLMDEDDDDHDDVMMVMTLQNAADCIGCEACSKVCPKACHTHSTMSA